jgi:hypothetical protein
MKDDERYANSLCSYGSGTIREERSHSTYYYIKKITGAKLTDAGK